MPFVAAPTAEPAEEIANETQEAGMTVQVATVAPLGRIVHVTRETRKTVERRRQSPT